MGHWQASMAVVVVTRAARATHVWRLDGRRHRTVSSRDGVDAGRAELGGRVERVHVGQLGLLRAPAAAQQVRTSLLNVRYLRTRRGSRHSRCCSGIVRSCECVYTADKMLKTQTHCRLRPLKSKHLCTDGRQ